MPHNRPCTLKYSPLQLSTPIRVNPWHATQFFAGTINGDLLGLVVGRPFMHGEGSQLRAVHLAFMRARTALLRLTPLSSFPRSLVHHYGVRSPHHPLAHPSDQGTTCYTSNVYLQ